MAGMSTLKLVEMGKASAGVSIDAMPPKNVFYHFKHLKRCYQHLDFFLLLIFYG